MTLNEVWGAYIAHKRTHVRPSTVAAYTGLWQSISGYFGPMDVDGVRTKSVEKWCMEQLCALQKKSIMDRLVLVNNILDFAEYEYEIPVTKIQLKYIRWPKSAEPKAQLDESSTYTPDELKRIVNYVALNPSPSNILISIMIATGIRIGEACALTFRDIDCSVGGIVISKTLERIWCQGDTELLSEARLASCGISILSKGKKTALLLGAPKSKAGFRTIPLPKELLKVLKGFKALLPEHYYIGTHRPKPIEPRVLRSHYRHMVRDKVGLSRCLKPHAMRHTFASILVTSGTDVRTVAEILGHSDMSTTLTVYSHASVDSKRKAIGRTIARQFQSSKWDAENNKKS